MFLYMGFSHHSNLFNPEKRLEEINVFHVCFLETDAVKCCLLKGVSFAMGSFWAFHSKLLGRRWFIIASQCGSIAFQPQRRTTWSIYLNFLGISSAQGITGFTLGLR